MIRENRKKGSLPLQLGQRSGLVNVFLLVTQSTFTSCVLLEYGPPCCSKDFGLFELRMIRRVPGETSVRPSWGITDGGRGIFIPLRFSGYYFTTKTQ